MTDISGFAESVPNSLGVSASYEDDELVVSLTPTPFTLVHGFVRASVLAYAIDVVTGVFVDRDPEVWTFTSDLSVRMRLVPAPERVDSRTSVLRQGTRSVTCDAELVDQLGRPFAYGAAGFAHLARRPDDPPKPWFDLAEAPKLLTPRSTLSAPLPEAAGIEVLDAAHGVVEMPVTDAVRNPSGTVQGAMVALVAECAAEAFASTRLSTPAIVTEMDIRYVARADVGPVRARTRALDDRPDGPLLVELFDTSKDRITSHVLVRAVAAP